MQGLALGQYVEFGGKNSDDASAVYISARYRNFDTLDFLIAGGSSVNPLGGYYGNPLQAAAFHGYKKALRILLDHEADQVATGESEDVVQAAIAGGQQQTIQLLIPREDTARVCDLEAALMNACYAGYHSTVTLVLDRIQLTQAVSKPNVSGMSLKFMGVQSCSSELTLTPAHNQIHQALQLALYRGRASVAKALLAIFDEVNVTGGHFRHLLQAAPSGGHETTVRYLIDRGADVHSKGRYGTPVTAASLGGQNDVVPLLLLYGANLDSWHSSAS